VSEEERNRESQQSEAAPTPSAISSSSESEGQPSPSKPSEEEKPSQKEPEEENEAEESPPYNFRFARWAIGAGLLAYGVTILFLIIFTTELDAAAVTGALGALFTLIGTVSGAYFGIKRSSDTEDKGRRAESAANNRVQEANKIAREAAGAMDPTEWEKVRQRI
jgi:uncharacterized membrane protein